MKSTRRTRILATIVFVALVGVVLYTAIVFTGVSTYVMLQTFVGAIFLGGFYSVVAAGLTVNFGITRILNVAHGELMIIGAYVTYFLTLYLGIEPLFTIPFAVLVVALIGIPIQRFLISKPQKDPGGREGMFLSFLILVSLSLIFQNSMTLAWTANDRAVHSILTGTRFNLFGVIIPILRLVVFIIAVASILCIDLFMYKTSVGKKILATVQEKTAARLVGINVDRMYLYAFVIASAAAGLAGSLIGIATSFNPYSGLLYVLYAFAVMTMSGLEKVKGTIVVGLLMGLLESYAGLFLGEVFRYTIVFLVLLITLVVKPTGLFGKVKH